jgi:hypothetical protein
VVYCSVRNIGPNRGRSFGRFAADPNERTTASFPKCAELWCVECWLRSWAATRPFPNPGLVGFPSAPACGSLGWMPSFFFGDVTIPGHPYPCPLTGVPATTFPSPPKVVGGNQSFRRGLPCTLPDPLPGLFVRNRRRALAGLTTKMESFSAYHSTSADTMARRVLRSGSWNNPCWGYQQTGEGSSNPLLKAVLLCFLQSPSLRPPQWRPAKPERNASRGALALSTAAFKYIRRNNTSS